MKETPLSLCERASVISAITRGIRHDNRDFLEVRDINVSFGKDYGSCTVTLGQTRVLAQVTCEVVEPRPSRPNEGKISIAVHLSPMAAPHFEQGRGNDLLDELQQILDRNIKESRCLDIESLCIMADESVWQFRVDVTVLNHAGNLGDACNIASVAALRHFHRPDVTVEEDGRVTVHTLEEREPIATYMKKVPVCLTYAFFVIEDNTYMLMDPSDKEERVMTGKLVVGLNPHGEITSLVFPGRVLLDKNDIVNCIKNAFLKAKKSAEMVQRLVEEDLEKRKGLVKAAGYARNLTSDTTYTENLIKKKIKNACKFKFQIPREPDDEDSDSRDMPDEDMKDENGEESMEDSDVDADILSRIQSIRQFTIGEASTSKPMESDSESDSEEEAAKPSTSKYLESYSESDDEEAAAKPSTSKPMESDSESDSEEAAAKPSTSKPMESDSEEEAAKPNLTSESDSEEEAKPNLTIEIDSEEEAKPNLTIEIDSEEEEVTPKLTAQDIM